MDSMPVFRGLGNVAVPDREIAAIVGVKAPVFSKWRSGRLPVPGRELVLLTLLLAHWIDEQETQCAREADAGLRRRAGMRLKTTRRCLLQQEIINQRLPAETVRRGSHRFRRWWFREDIHAAGVASWGT